MKKYLAFLLLGSLLFLGSCSTSGSAKASLTTDNIKVRGNCGQCKSRIEKAAYSLNGVNKASWNDEKEMLTVTYDASKTNVDAIEKKMASVGHDTDKYKADPKIYGELPACCKYERH